MDKTKLWNKKELEEATKAENLRGGNGGLYDSGVLMAYKDFQYKGCDYEWVKKTLPEAAKEAFTHGNCFSGTAQGYFNALKELYYAFNECYVELPLVSPYYTQMDF